MLSKKQTEQRHAILEALYLHGPLSRAELSRLLDITPATMSLITSHLIQDGLLRELGEETGSTKIGRKKVLLAVEAALSYYVGVELTDTKMFICLTDNLGANLVEQVIEMGGLDEPHKIEDLLVKSLKNFLQVNESYPVSAMGIAVPGHYDKVEENIISNHPFWSKFSIKCLKSAFSIPIYIKNNVKCMALRELYLGENKDTKNFLFLNLRRGIYAAYVYDGAIYADDNYLIGEVGHVVVNPNGERCEWCGQSGCLQTYASITWILKKVRYAYEVGKTPYLAFLVEDAESIRLSHVLTAYKMGDGFIQYLIEQALDYLAIQLYNVQMILNIDALFIHGTLFQNPDIAAKLERKLSHQSTIIQSNRPTLKLIKPYNPMEGALGASSLAILRHFIYQE